MRDIIDKSVEEKILKLARYPDENPSPVLRISDDGVIIYANRSSEPLLSLWKCQVGQSLPPDWKNLLTDIVKWQTKDIEVESEGLTFSLKFSYVECDNYVNVYGSDITARKQAQRAARIMHSFLQIANRNAMITPLLKDFVAELKSTTRCTALGIRLLNDAGDMPYEACEGFSGAFHESEKTLSINGGKCQCYNVLRGAAGAKLPYYTEGGSFYTNSATHFASATSALAKATPIACQIAGFESIALVPIIVGEKTRGLIHAADCRPNMVPIELVKVLEDVAMQLGVALGRAMTNEELRRSRERYHAIFDASVNALLVHGLDGDGMPGKLSEVNQAACSMLGYSRTELLNLSPVDLAKEGRDPQVIRRLLADKTVSTDQTFIAKGGKEIPVEIKAQLIQIHGQPVVLSVVRDVSLRLQNEHLEQQLKASAELQVKILNERAQYLEMLTRRECQLSRIYQALVQIRRDSGSRAAVSDFLDLILKDVDISAERAYVFWAGTPEIPRMEMRAFRGDTPPYVPPRLGGLRDSAIRTGQIQYVHGDANPGIGNPSSKLKGAHSSVAIPVKSARKPVGAVVLHSNQAHAFDREMDFFQAVGSACSVLLDHGKYFGQSRAA